MANNNLSAAKSAKNDEWSNFTKFFAQNFERFGLKKLISTSYAVESKNIKTVYQPTLFEMDAPQFDKKKTRPMSLMTERDNIKYSKHKEVKGIGYQKYENYDAIEVPFTDAIPSDHRGAMGVPISFLDKYCPEQFELLGHMDSHGKVPKGIPDEAPYLNGKWVYSRILIRFRKEVMK